MRAAEKLCPNVLHKGVIEFYAPSKLNFIEISTFSAPRADVKK